MTELTESEQRIILTVWEDHCRLIAALKLQRWDITKWTVTINIGLAGAAAAIQSVEKVWFILFAITVFSIGIYLLYYYNDRITRVRKHTSDISELIKESIYDYEAGVGETIDFHKGKDYDYLEISAFYGVMIISIFPIFAIVLFG